MIVLVLVVVLGRPGRAQIDDEHDLGDLQDSPLSSLPNPSICETANLTYSNLRRVP